MEARGVTLLKGGKYSSKFKSVIWHYPTPEFRQTFRTEIGHDRTSTKRDRTYSSHIRRKGHKSLQHKQPPNFDRKYPNECCVFDRLRCFVPKQRQKPITTTTTTNKKGSFLGREFVNDIMVTRITKIYYIRTCTLVR